MFIRFDRVYERDRHTDKQTDRQTPHDSRGRACIALRGKNGQDDGDDDDNDDDDDDDDDILCRQKRTQTLRELCFGYRVMLLNFRKELNNIVCEEPPSEVR